jgi:hypothetical protein
MYGEIVIVIVGRGGEGEGGYFFFLCTRLDSGEIFVVKR